MNIYYNENKINIKKYNYFIDIRKNIYIYLNNIF